MGIQYFLMAITFFTIRFVAFVEAFSVMASEMAFERNQSLLNALPHCQNSFFFLNELTVSVGRGNGGGIFCWLSNNVGICSLSVEIRVGVV